MTYRAKALARSRHNRERIRRLLADITSILKTHFPMPKPYRYELPNPLIIRRESQ